jgi:hypothetical protein
MKAGRLMKKLLEHEPAAAVVALVNPVMQRATVAGSSWASRDGGDATSLPFTVGSQKVAAWIEIV